MLGVGGRLSYLASNTLLMVVVCRRVLSVSLC